MRAVQLTTCTGYLGQSFKVLQVRTLGEVVVVNGWESPDLHLLLALVGRHQHFYFAVESATGENTSGPANSACCLTVSVLTTQVGHHNQRDLRQVDDG